jgi:hypothetical protein
MRGQGSWISPSPKMACRYPVPDFCRFSVMAY